MNERRTLRPTLHDRDELFSLSRLESDLQDQSTNSLIDPLGEPTLQLLSLVILGRALPYLHNGIMVVDCDDGDDFAVRSYRFTHTQYRLQCTYVDGIKGRRVRLSVKTLDRACDILIKKPTFVKYHSCIF